AGFRDGQRRPDRLEVAHLADEYDVRVLPQRVLERRREARGVGADLALVDDAIMVAVDELDRVLHRDDVPLHLAVDLVDHRGERGALPRAGGPRHEHQAAGPLREQGPEVAGGHRPGRHAAVSFATSSRLVMPRLTFSIPSMRSVRMPSLTASSRSSSVDAPRNTMRRNALDIDITS